MMGRARTAMKFFFYGLVIGILFAPRAGAETRAQIVAWAEELFKGEASG